MFLGPTEAPCAPPWEQDRPAGAWVPPARRHTLLLAQGSAWLISITVSFSESFSVLKDVSAYKKQESCGLLTHICIKPQTNLPLLLFSIPSDD